MRVGCARSRTLRGNESNRTRRGDVIYYSSIQFTTGYQRFSTFATWSILIITITHLELVWTTYAFDAIRWNSTVSDAHQSPGNDGLYYDQASSLRGPHRCHQVMGGGAHYLATRCLAATTKQFTTAGHGQTVARGVQPVGILHLPTL